MTSSSTDKELVVDHEEDKEKKKKKKKKHHSKKVKKEKKDKKSSSSSKQKKRKHDDVVSNTCDSSSPEKKKEKKLKKKSKSSSTSSTASTGAALSFDYKYIMAPMVGASELPFRLLCRKYGTQLAYTPMMSSTQFSTNPTYRQTEFQTIPQDRPLVCHFSANQPEEFAQAAKLVEHCCDAIDLNLGCPQRTAYLGHFGSYLLEPKDRKLICNIVKRATEVVSIPIFCKIRLLNTIEETVELCRQLRDAGASLIAIHARYRASYERKGAGARDGPAMLDQVLEIREVFKKDHQDYPMKNRDIPIIANGNVITYDDVEANLKFTKADGIMSAEGILDNPALFLPRYGSDEDTINDNVLVDVAIPSALDGHDDGDDSSPTANPTISSDDAELKKNIRKYTKKLRAIEAIEAKVAKGETINQDQRDKLITKESVQKAMSNLQNTKATETTNDTKQTQDESLSSTTTTTQTQKVKLTTLYKAASNKAKLASEYLDLAQKYPTKIRTVVFHTRRILKEELNQYQLMEECIASKTIQEVRNVIQKIVKYQKDPTLFQYDTEKAKRDKEALEHKKREEGKRKQYEARMIRKAKREGKLDDLEYYLRIGAKVPTEKEVKKLRKLSKKEQLAAWKEGDHSQHCLAFHLEEGGCKRDRACAFMHVEAFNERTFVEMDEVAG